MLMDLVSSRARIADQGVKDYVEATLFETVRDGITAFAGGGQAGGVQITTSIARITVVATIADSVKLPPAKAGSVVYLVNSAANSANVFPVTGEQINAAGSNTAVALAGGSKGMYFCPLDGRWFSIITV